MNGEGGKQSEMESSCAREWKVSLNFSIKQNLVERKHQQSFNMFNRVESSNAFQTRFQFSLSSWTPAVQPHMYVDVNIWEIFKDLDDSRGLWDNNIEADLWLW